MTGIVERITQIGINLDEIIPPLDFTERETDDYFLDLISKRKKLVELRNNPETTAKLSREELDEVFKKYHEKIDRLMFEFGRYKGAYDVKNELTKRPIRVTLDKEY